MTGRESGAGTRASHGDGIPTGISTTDPLPTARDAIFRRLLIVADLLGVLGALLLVGAISPQGFSAKSLTLLPMTVLLAKVAGRYDHDEVVLRKSTLDEIPSLLTLAAAIAVAWSLLAAAEGVPRSHGVGGLWAATSLCLIVSRLAARALARRWAPDERVLVIGTASARARFARRLAADPVARTEVVGFLPLEDEHQVQVDPGAACRHERQLSIGELEPLVRELQVGRIFVIGAGAGSDVAYDALAMATSVGVKVSILPNELEVVGSSVELDEVGGLAVLSVRSPGLGRSSRVVKRAFDLTGSLLGLAILSPLFALIAAATKLDSAGPVFFCQRRVGRDGAVFGMLKFRSMTDDAEAKREALLASNETEGLFKLRADPRVTRVGRLLRKASLDELPQLLNVIKGEMSLVGPRPLISDEDRLVEGRHRRRLQLAPGMTGPWQVLGPERPPLSEMVKIDFLYAANWSLWSDIKILVRTALHVSGRRGV
ncbi:MAG: exopolysaccharide biosynthesis polyprenyl glycosylphosphotransferase [Actinomycetota bacterium]|nr:exopolysaccharide biosynthesis polyprenyl glycosylphosphotransferase [Actinomycetota bacterium]